MDPCECMYVWAMRRLMSWLQTQNHCTDTECFTEHPGFQGGGSGGDTGAMTQFALVLLVWLMIAVVLFIYRPKSLRQSGDHKPRIRHRDEGPTPPPVQ